MNDVELLQAAVSLERNVRLEVPQSQLKSLVKELEAGGYFVAEVDRAPVFNKEILLHAMYQSCRFPAYFGFNWDALSDCLSEICYGDEKGYFLVFNDWVLLETEASQDAKVFMEILEDAQKICKEQNKPFRLLTVARS